MKYKAYQQNPHSALEEVYKAFDDEKPYKAQSICLTYFNYLENQKHIDKALDYVTKDNVYNYVVNSMNKESSDYYRNKFKEKIEKLEEQSKEFSQASAVLERFCEDNNIDLNSIVEQYSKKMTKNMSKEELLEANKLVSERQEGKIVVSKDIKLMPSGEEFSKLMEEQGEINLKSYENAWKD